MKIELPYIRLNETQLDNLVHEVSIAMYSFLPSDPEY